MSNQDGPSAEKPSLCHCARYCGIEGKYTPISTFYRHQDIERRDTAAAVGSTTSREDEHDTSRLAPRRRRQPEPETEDPLASGAAQDLMENEPQREMPDDVNMGNEPAVPDPIAGPAVTQLDPPELPPRTPPSNPHPISVNHSDDEPDSDEQRPPSPTNEPVPMGDVETSIKEFQLANKFIEGLRSATLDDEREDLDPDFVYRLRNPVTGTPELDEDERLSLDLFLSITNASVETYNSVRTAVLRRHPDDPILSYHEVKKLVTVLSGIAPITRDMCVNSCIAYTGPFSNLTCCPYDGEPRYDANRTAAQVPRKQFCTFPIGPQIQALRRSPQGAEEVRYRERCTVEVLAELAANDDEKIAAYKDFFDGTDYLDAVDAGKIQPNDTILFISVDGAQLYRNKESDCWISAFIVADRKPKNMDSFLYPGLHHLAALQHEGLKVWDAIDDEIMDTHPFLALVCADGPGMACINGCGATSHDDIQLGPLLDGFDSEEAATRYKRNINFVGQSRNKTEYEERRLETGISKPSIFSGLPDEHTLGLPDAYSLDFMHLPTLNLPDLMIPLWRGKFDCDKTDSTDSWDWAVLIGETWLQHGKAVANLTRYFPPSFDRTPRNPAEKISSGYKAWEFLLYFYGIGPALLYGILPEEYYKNYCQVVRGVRLLLQTEILPSELLESHERVSQFSDGFELLYVGRRADRIHFVRPVIHTLSHMAGETARKGPGNIYSQWPLERTIGNLGQEIRQHSNPFANLSQRALQRCQVNALMTIIPDLEPNKDQLPRGAIDLGNGYRLLRAKDSCGRPVRPCEEASIRIYIEQEFGEDAAEDWYPSVVRWARVRLPTGQIARSLWKEEKKAQVRTARHVKIETENLGITFAEVLFYFILTIEEEERYLAVTALFGAPDPHLLDLSSQTYWSVKHLRDDGVQVVNITDIQACVMMGPDYQYAHHLSDGSEVDRWFLVEKPGLKLAYFAGSEEDMDTDI
ncbi:hypothetical protein B0H15DRAFT_965693 [Mycena belliarum]|uniref:Uncharacterized protein n=1 Tax=Mycena belliarum TaxID=1033014 RepID=A0AAD6TR41_9AGAR|nr:hypothetical protein B0H15DRAFT_965693 [Mycena belliae]